MKASNDNGGGGGDGFFTVYMTMLRVDMYIVMYQDYIFPTCRTVAILTKNLTYHGMEPLSWML